MGSVTTTRGRDGLYYGWVIVAACFLITTSTFGSGFSFGVFLTPFRESFGWTSASISMAYSLCLFVYTGLATLAGWSVDKYGPKVTTMTGGFLLGTGLLLTSQVNAIWQLYLTYGLIGAGMSGAYTPLMTTVSRWFTKRRGLALGIVVAGIGAGPLIMAPLASYLISAYGWRFTFLIMGSTGGLIIFAALLLRGLPPATVIFPNEDIHSTGIPQPEAKAGNVSLEASDFSLKEALSTRTFLLIAGAFFMVGVGLQIVVAHTVAYSVGRGLAPVTAAGVLSTITGTSIAGRIISGIISDRVGRKKTLATSVFIEGIMLIWLIGASSAWMLFVFAVIFGFGYGGHTTQFPALTGEMFGLRHMGKILGAVVFFWGLGGALGAFLAGYIFDLAGSYSSAFVVGAVAMFIAGAVSFFLKAPKKST